MGAIMDGQEDVHMAVFSALCVKGETDSEVRGAVEAMRERAAKITPVATDLLDTCAPEVMEPGPYLNGGRLACAAAGKTVAKHGNRPCPRAWVRRSLKRSSSY